MKKQLLSLAVLLFVFAQTSLAQKVTSTVSLGWSSPKGEAFEDNNGDKMAGGGLMIDADIMYHVTPKLSAGILLQNNLLFAASVNELEVGIWGLDIYGLKGEYRFSESKVSPYAGLTLGLSQFGLPEITSSDGTVLTEKETKSSFGVRPEVGVYLGGVKLSAAYILPMKYEFNDEKRSAGAFQVSLGFRWKWWEQE